MLELTSCTSQTSDGDQPDLWHLLVCHVRLYLATNVATQCPDLQSLSLECKSNNPASAVPESHKVGLDELVTPKTIPYSTNVSCHVLSFQKKTDHWGSFSIDVK